MLPKTRGRKSRVRTGDDGDDARLPRVADEDVRGQDHRGDVDQRVGRDTHLWRCWFVLRKRPQKGLGADAVIAPVAHPRHWGGWRVVNESPDAVELPVWALG